MGSKGVEVVPGSGNGVVNSSREHQDDRSG